MFRPTPANLCPTMRVRYFDISVPICEEMLVWPGDPGVKIERSRHVSHDATILGARLALGSHTGTHLDAPLHFSAGEGTVDAIPPEALIGPARVLDLRGNIEIGRAELEAAKIAPRSRVLLRTDNSNWVRRGPMPERPAHLTGEGARYLVERETLLVGVDGLSVDLPGRHEAHLALLGAGIPLLEAVDLSAVEPGDYHLICLPLRLAGGEAAPARALLLK